MRQWVYLINNQDRTIHDDVKIFVQLIQKAFESARMFPTRQPNKLKEVTAWAFPCSACRTRRSVAMKRSSIALKCSTKKKGSIMSIFRKAQQFNNSLGNYLLRNGHVSKCKLKALATDVSRTTCTRCLMAPRSWWSASKLPYQTSHSISRPIIFHPPN